jgi:hypothetical protein
MPGTSGARRKSAPTTISSQAATITTYFCSTFFLFLATAKLTQEQILSPPFGGRSRQPGGESFVEQRESMSQIG